MAMKRWRSCLWTLVHRQKPSTATATLHSRLPYASATAMLRMLCRPRGGARCCGASDPPLPAYHVKFWLRFGESKGGGCEGRGGWVMWGGQFGREGDGKGQKTASEGKQRGRNRGDFVSRCCCCRIRSHEARYAHNRSTLRVQAAARPARKLVEPLSRRFGWLCSRALRAASLLPPSPERTTLIFRMYLGV